MAWRQSPGGSEQHLTRAAAAARTRTQRPGKHLAVHASELVVKPDFQILRRYRQPLLLRLEHTHRPTLEDYVHRATRLGSSRSLNLRIGISSSKGSYSIPSSRGFRHKGLQPHRTVISVGDKTWRGDTDHRQAVRVPRRSASQHTSLPKSPSQP